EIGQRVDHQQVEGLLALSRGEAGDERLPLSDGWAGAAEGTADEADILLRDAEALTALVPDLLEFFGDHEGLGGPDGKTAQLPAGLEHGKKDRSAKPESGVARKLRKWGHNLPEATGAVRRQSF